MLKKFQVAAQAHFVAVHMQEAGGKNFEEFTVQVPGMVEKIAFRMNCLGYTIGRAYLDLDFENVDQYTALGSMYFFMEVLYSRIEQYDFVTHEYSRLNKGFEMMEKEIDKCSKIRKKKFPKDFWPRMKWGRKGYMHSRFRFNNQPIDIVNVHLFHDDSNIALIQENPLMYSENRKRALNYVLDEVSRNCIKQNDTPLFIFGDLNFRLNCLTFLNRITEGADIRHDSLESFGSLKDSAGSSNRLGCGNILSMPSDHLKRSISAVEFRKTQDSLEDRNNCVLRIEKKRFDYINHKQLLNEWHQYLEDDREAKNFPMLFELPIHFPPTYPWSEDPTESGSFMKTRAPAWCDRVLMNSDAFQLVNSDNDAKYDSIGKIVCMGDHKVIIYFLAIDVIY
ncbi:unnamed protein product [Dracunculus medinensis]|uniref:inositol-polyphosphate 5-phosphatase n=1 Tax=Dracunculus medinensis TaxID=318479 RepID=A0A3P7PP13_DRAME|nr:unnamed protein product [Dracunculus medinensis]